MCSRAMRIRKRATSRRLGEKRDIKVQPNVLKVDGEALKGCGTALEDNKEALKNNASILMGEGGALKCDA